MTFEATEKSFKVFLGDETFINNKPGLRGRLQFTHYIPSTRCRQLLEVPCPVSLCEDDGYPDPEKVRLNLNMLDSKKIQLIGRFLKLLMVVI